MHKLSNPISAESISKLSLAEALASARDTKVLRIGPGVGAVVPVVFAGEFPDRKALVVADDASFDVAGRQVAGLLTAAGLIEAAPYIFHENPLPAEYSFVEKLETELRRNSAIPVAVGSGTINDLVKLAAHRAGRPYLCVATAASMDGYTAFGASITFQGAKQTFNCPAPRAVIADIDIIGGAPCTMTASGFADLQAKLTAGADWILADALHVEPIEPRAWEIVQGGLHDALADPAGARAGRPAAITPLVEGLMLGGFAMQWSESSRPASGAEHQFSHLWDMEHHVHNGQPPSHGFKVGIATLAIASLYETLLTLPLNTLDIETCCARWPDWKTQEADIRQRFAGQDFIQTAVDETAAKFPSPAQLREQLTLLKNTWATIRQKLRAQLPSLQDLRRNLQNVGAPTEPEEIGLTRERLRAAFHRAYFIRRRFTVLDLVVRTGTLETCLDALFGAKGPWAKIN